MTARNLRPKLGATEGILQELRTLRRDLGELDLGKECVYPALSLARRLERIAKVLRTYNNGMPGPGRYIHD